MQINTEVFTKILESGNDTLYIELTPKGCSGNAFKLTLLNTNSHEANISLSPEVEPLSNDLRVSLEKTLFSEEIKVEYLKSKAVCGCGESFNI